MPLAVNRASAQQGQRERATSNQSCHRRDTQSQRLLPVASLPSAHLARAEGLLNGTGEVSDRLERPSAEDFYCRANRPSNCAGGRTAVLSQGTVEGIENLVPVICHQGISGTIQHSIPASGPPAAAASVVLTACLGELVPSTRYIAAGSGPSVAAESTELRAEWRIRGESRGFGVARRSDTATGINEFCAVIVHFAPSPFGQPPLTQDSVLAGLFAKPLAVVETVFFLVGIAPDDASTDPERLDTDSITPFLLIPSNAAGVSRFNHGLLAGGRQQSQDAAPVTDFGRPSRRSLRMGSGPGEPACLFPPKRDLRQFMTRRMLISIGRPSAYIVRLVADIVTTRRSTTFQPRPQGHPATDGYFRQRPRSRADVYAIIDHPTQDEPTIADICLEPVVK
ncbi:hypothetical protein MAPG_10965 [Magnaporthiopsis poae ATCC 64411]|uniref:Uncharacterized protein n=1 Tax=Magnaporthiopsis poae (strain ATCC 64411 / 73-15) TaxID=644358 RepID=A0A0C4EE04_MAGP6|nr:hypothetical protein MAPG_10965 [Magnaporthiopsis poae ATCC 64411]